MGQRANLLIVEGGQYQLFYSHWCANTLPRDLFWGPKYAVQFIRQQRAVDQESGWLDDVWAEGAAVVDLDRQVLLLFGGEDILYDVPLRRVYLDCLGRVWKDWEVRWAHEGIVAIADYVGVPKTKVLSAEKDGAVCSLAPPQERDWTDLVGSIRWGADWIRLYPMAGDVDASLASGPELLNAPEAAGGLTTLPLGEWAKSFPTGGFHIDVPSQIVEFWTARDAPDVLWRVSKHWADWTVRWHQDEFEFQLERTEGLQFPGYTWAKLEKQIAEMLLYEPGRSGADTVRELAAQMGAEGQPVDINPWALRDDRLELSLEVRRKIVASAIGSERTA